MVSDRDRRQLEAIKALGRRWCADPVQLRLVVAVAILGVGFGLVQLPLGSRLAKARTAHEEAVKQARLADDLRFLSTQAAGYEKRVAISADLVDWQNYVLERLRTTSATLVSLEPKSTTQKPPFDVLEMELVSKGTNFQDYVDFIDRLEHGERLVRIEKLRIERQQTSVYVTMIIKGLVRVGGKTKDPDGKTATSPKAGAGAAGSRAPAPDAAGAPAVTPDDADATAAPTDGAKAAPTDDSSDAPSGDAAPDAPAPDAGEEDGGG